MERDLPRIECEEGYPTEAAIEALELFCFDRTKAARFLVEEFPRACEGISCCSVSVEDAKDIIGRDCKLVKFSTGGWSGAEELIGTMLSHIWIKQMHSKWECGGHYEFSVPASLLQPAPALS